MSGWPNLSDLVVAASERGAGRPGRRAARRRLGHAGPLRPRAGGCCGRRCAGSAATMSRPGASLRRRSPTAAMSSSPACRSSEATHPHPRRGRGERRGARADAARRRQQCGDAARRARTWGCRWTRVGLITLDAHFDMRDTRRRPQQRQPGARADRGRAAGREHRAGRPRELRQQPRDARGRGRRGQSRGDHRRSAAAAESRAAIDRALDHVSHCDAIVVDCDIDVIDRSQFPAAPGARPGGMAVHDFFYCRPPPRRRPAGAGDRPHRMGPAARPDRPQRFDRRPLGRRVPCRVRDALGSDFRCGGSGATTISFASILAHAFPRDAPPVLLRGQPLDEAAGAAHQRDDPAAFAMHFVHSAERLAVERPDLGVAEVGQPHHSAPRRGIQRARPCPRPRGGRASRRAHLRCTALPMSRSPDRSERGRCGRRRPCAPASTAQRGSRPA